MFHDGDNPLRQIGTGYSGGVITNAVWLPPPSSYVCEIEDVSGANAKRTEDTVMHKKKIGQAIAISVTYKMISVRDCAKLLQAFNPEYLFAEFLDPKAGDYRILEFYVGNRSVPLYNAGLGKWESLSFKIIQRDARK